MPNNTAKLLVALPLDIPPLLPLPGPVVVAPTVPSPLPRPLPLSLAALAVSLEGSKIVLVDKLIVKQRIKDLNM